MNITKKYKDEIDESIMILQAGCGLELEKVTQRSGSILLKDRFDSTHALARYKITWYGSIVKNAPYSDSINPRPLHRMYDVYNQVEYMQRRVKYYDHYDYITMANRLKTYINKNRRTIKFFVDGLEPER